MNPNKLMVGEKYLIFHNRRGFWPEIFRYSGPEPNLLNVEKFEIVDQYKFAIEATRIFDHTDIENRMYPYSNKLFKYLDLFSTD